MPAVLLLPTGKALTVRTAADAFLDSLGNPNTVRNYGIAVGKTAERIGEGRPPATSARTLAWPATHTGRPARCSTSTPRRPGPAPARICTSTATPP